MIMTTLASAGLGLFGSALPELMSYFQKKADRDHELRMIQLETSSAEARALIRERAQTREAESAELAAMYKNADTSKSYRWIDAIYKATRPGITWLVILQWCLVNVAEMVWLIQNQGTWTAVTEAWSEYDQAIMTAVIMFWFGHRAMMRTVGRHVA